MLICSYVFEDFFVGVEIGDVFVFKVYDFIC